jgi:hypothetical protein
MTGNILNLTPGTPKRPNLLFKMSSLNAPTGAFKLLLRIFLRADVSVSVNMEVHSTIEFSSLSAFLNELLLLSLLGLLQITHKSLWRQNHRTGSGVPNQHLETNAPRRSSRKQRPMFSTLLQKVKWLN